MTHRPLKVAFAFATIGAWLAFLYLDSLWSACLRGVEEEGRKVYGELYGPLSFFRPVSMWVAAALSMVSAAWLGLRNEPIQPPQRNAGGRPSSGDSSASETPSSLGPRG